MIRYHSFQKFVIISVLMLFLIFPKSFAISTNHWETFIFPNTTWNYFVGTNTPPPADWYMPAFDDHLWSSGKGSFGYGDGDDTTIITPCISLFIRHSFTLADTSLITEGQLNIDYDDGFIAYLNGVEIGRANILGVHPDYAAVAFADHEAKMYQGGKPDAFYLNKEILKTILKQGINVLSIEIHNASAVSTDMSAIPYLSFGIKTAAILTTTTPEWLIKLFDSNLPILKIYTQGNVIPDSPKITATLQVINNTTPGARNSINDPATDFDGYIGIEVRGASSQMNPKKSYTVETRNAAGQDSSI